MMNKKKTQALAIVLIGATVMSSLTGCSSIVGTDVKKLPLVSPLTEKEVVDYYAEGLKYDAVITKNNEVHETTYVEKEIKDEEKKAKLVELQKKAQDILSEMEYEYNRENIEVLSEDSFHYIKSYLNGNKLDNGEVIGVTGALGYYFVDVKYDLTPRSIGDFTELASLMGINGAFVRDAFGVDTIDKTFLGSAASKLNQYYIDNKVLKSVEFDEGSGEIVLNEEDSIVANSNENSEYTNDYIEGELLDETIPQASLDDIVSNTDNTVPEENTVDTTVTEENNTEVGTDIPVGADTPVVADTPAEADIPVGEDTTVEEIEDEPLVETTTQTIGGMEYVSYTPNDRKCKIDTTLFNTVVGSSYKSTAYVPQLDLVFNIPESEGEISGIGIYPSGGNGLALFGYDRNQIAGSCTLRYVFKDSVDGSGKILGVNVYPKMETVTTGFTTSDSNVVIPDFLRLEFEKLLERADRAIIDNLTAALMSGSIYEDMGFAVLRGYEYEHVNLNKNMSTIRQIIARDIDKNAYLLEVESTRIEGAKDVDSYGTYRDKYYIVIQQKGSEFIITDQIRVSRLLTKEPSINPDSSTVKRLVALNLAGEVNETAKTEINTLLSDWYKAGTLRILNVTGKEPKEVKYKGSTVTATKGMYDCFNSDPTMLSSQDLEYMNSEVRALLIKKGTNVTTTFEGTVTEWLGGHENQVEFTTEELINYEGKNEAVYMEVYYLVSKMNDEWVIDERKVLSEDTVSGNEIANIQSRLK